MEKKFRKSLFLFRRDLRLEDNTGLIFALKSSEVVVPAFIFTPEQIEKNPFRSDHCLKFMIESLKDLENQLKKKGGRLFFFKGKPEEVVSKCIRELNIEALIVNRDYTPYSHQRDKKLEKVCKTGHIPFYSFDDALLHPPEETLKKDGKPYTIFTPYFRECSKQKVLPPAQNKGTNYFHGSISFAEDKGLLNNKVHHYVASKLSEISERKVGSINAIQPTLRSLISDVFTQRNGVPYCLTAPKSSFPKPTVENGLIGGRSEALKILKKLSSFGKYGRLRDFPAEEYSTHLSPYLKFTVCSPREVYAAICRNLSPHHELIRALYWRDFFTSIAFFFPHVFTGAFHHKFDKLKWSYNKKAYQRWCEGSTGFPIVDAGMREMNETGFMHNRVRMITASFLIKDLHIDWRWGEKYFAQSLVDYDPAVNNGNWQWVASTGSDAQPYFRIFNPWRQQKKFDPKCIYIKKWIPELRDFPPKAIHAWYEERYRAGYKKYPAPITNHEKAAKEALHAYKSV